MGERSLAYKAAPTSRMSSWAILFYSLVRMRWAREAAKPRLLGFSSNMRTCKGLCHTLCETK